MQGADWSFGVRRRFGHPGDGTTHFSIGDGGV
jgi:hypothetical protein